MQKDFAETQSNPVIRVLERHDALELLNDPSIKLFPQVLGLCDFERDGLRYTGEFVSEDEEIEINYDMYPHNGKDMLFCTATAPLERWHNWQNGLPQDFLKALAANSPYFQIDPSLPLTHCQQLIFSGKEVEKYTYLYTRLSLGEENVTIFKDYRHPVIIDSDRHILRRLLKRRYF